MFSTFLLEVFIKLTRSSLSLAPISEEDWLLFSSNIALLLTLFEFNWQISPTVIFAEAVFWEDVFRTVASWSKLLPRSSAKWSELRQEFCNRASSMDMSSGLILLDNNSVFIFSDWFSSAKFCCLLVVVRSNGYETWLGSLLAFVGGALVKSIAFAFWAVLTVFGFFDRAFFAFVTVLGCVDDVQEDGVVVNCVCCSGNEEFPSKPHHFSWRKVVFWFQLLACRFHWVFVWFASSHTAIQYFLDFYTLSGQVNCLN